MPKIILKWVVVFNLFVFVRLLLLLLLLLLRGRWMLDSGRRLKDVHVHRWQFDVRPVGHCRLHRVGTVRSGHAQRSIPLLCDLSAHSLFRSFKFQSLQLAVKVTFAFIAAKCSFDLLFLSCLLSNHHPMSNQSAPVTSSSSSSSSLRTQPATFIH